MRSKKISFLIILTLLSSFILSSCTSNKEVYKDDEIIELKFGHIQNPGHSLYNAAEDLKEKIEDKTDGRVVVSIYPSSQLGTAREMMEQISMGTLDITFAGTSDWATGLDIKELAVYELPFLYSNLEQQKRLIDEILIDDVSKRFEGSPVRLLNVYSNGLRNPLIKNRPIEKLEDISSIKMRTPENPLFVDTWKMLGASTVTSPWGEVYTVLQQGVADACEADGVGLVNQNLQEVAKYYSKLNHMGAVYVTAINTDKWNRIPKDLQDIITECALENTEEQIKLREKEDLEAEESMLKAGVKINEIEASEIDRMREKVKPLYDNFANENDLHDLIDQIISLSKED